MTSPARVTGIARWDDLTERALAELEECDATYRPTSFWKPAVSRLLQDMADLGLGDFKRWPTAGYWFYPTYGAGATAAAAQRDFHAARHAWDQERWPFDLDGLGESAVGRPPQRYHLTGSPAVAWGKPYLNYLICLSALSRHVEDAPRSFLEIGGGFGVLGEILLSRDADCRYVNLDIPPLLTVASYYLSELFGARVATYDVSIPASGPLPVEGSACLPNYRLRDLRQSFDVFVNSFSFQEMEPDVVESYIELVSGIGPEYVVSLNSRKGKPKVSEGHEIGVLDQVTSAYVIEEFTRRGYRLCATYGRPLILSAGELAVLRRA